MFTAAHLVTATLGAADVSVDIAWSELLRRVATCAGRYTVFSLVTAYNEDTDECNDQQHEYNGSNYDTFLPTNSHGTVLEIWHDANGGTQCTISYSSC
jgi:hypothetical protein